MAASSQSLTAIGGASSPRQSLSDKLNGPWHERALQLFMLIVLTHWAEHFVQAYQVFVLGWPRPKANGILGLWYPWLIKSESLHYVWLRAGYAGLPLGTTQGIYRPQLHLVDDRVLDPVLAPY
jgi:hypothetical protein